MTRQGLLLIVLLCALGGVIMTRWDSLSLWLPAPGNEDADSFQAYADDGPAEPYEDWYPEDIRPPAGTSYPCALTALPRELPGIPGRDRRYINHVYSQILTCTQSKLSLLQALRTGNRVEDTRSDYDLMTGRALQRIRAEPVPAGLERFHSQVVQAIELQRAFFSKCCASMAKARHAASRMHQAEAQRHLTASWKKAMALPEGRRASGLLHAAWRQMQQRYGSHWPHEVKDSIYHHLCALDLF